MICQVLHIGPAEQDAMSIEDFEDACEYIDQVRNGGDDG